MRSPKLQGPNSTSVIGEILESRSLCGPLPPHSLHPLLPKLGLPHLRDMLGREVDPTGLGGAPKRVIFVSRVCPERNVLS